MRRVDMVVYEVVIYVLLCQLAITVSIAARKYCLSSFFQGMLCWALLPAGLEQARNKREHPLLNSAALVAHKMLSFVLGPASIAPAPIRPARVVNRCYTHLRWNVTSHG